MWAPDGHSGQHTFYRNNELAGYCGVLHALELRGIDGHYGDQRKVVIMSFGAVSRGAIYALKARGFRDITICIQRPDHEVREEVLDCHYVRLHKGGGGEPRMTVIDKGEILNKTIISFQNRQSHYPYDPLDARQTGPS